MRIALVNPIARRTQGYHTIGSYIPQLCLQVLADLVPAEHTVDIIDEIFGFEATDKRLRRGNYDLVGLTAYTSGATRAYEIARQCREEGIPTIMGGPHASAMPQEAAEHFDSIVIGECDESWPAIVEDAASGKLQQFYHGKLADISHRYGRARQQLQPVNGKYDVSCIQTSRGCPVGCEFCSVTTFSGAPIRRRDIGDIVEEWNQTLKPFIFVVDDNFFGVGDKHAIWAKELLRAIIKHGKKRLWFSQTTINMGDDPEGLELAYKAGCRGMLIGFESISRSALSEFHKGINRKNLDRYKELIDGYHRAGISVFGGFIIGSDDDHEESVAETALEAVRLGVDTIQITNLTPLPGTKMYDRYVQEGKIFATNYPQDWERYTFVETVYNPKNMSAERLDEAIFELRHAAATMPWVWKRTIKTLIKTRSLTTAIFIHGMNRGWQKMARHQAPRDRERFGYVPGIHGHGNGRYQKIKRAFGWSLAS